MKIESYNAEIRTCYLLGSTNLLIACADYLLSHAWVIKGVVTRDRDVIQWANEKSIQLYESSRKREFSSEPVDYIFSIINDEILSQSLLEKTRCLNINYHDSLLPDYAGLNSTAWAIFNKEETHGISWHVIDDGIDTGPILIQKTVEINSVSETAESLNIKCASKAIEAFKELIHEIELSTVTAQQQDLSKRTYYPSNKAFSGFGIIDWNCKAGHIDRVCRSLNFGSYNNRLTSAKVWLKRKLYVVSEVFVTKKISTVDPGKIAEIQDECVYIATADFNVGIKTILDFRGQLICFKELINKLNLGVNDSLSAEVSLSKTLISKISKAKLDEQIFVDRFSNYSPPILPKNNRVTINNDFPLISTIHLNNISENYDILISSILTFFHKALSQSAISIDIFKCRNNSEENICFLGYTPINSDFLKTKKLADIVSSVASQITNNQKNILKDIFIRYKKTIDIGSNRIAFTDADEDDLLSEYLIVFQWRKHDKQLNIYFKSDLADIVNSVSSGIEHVLRQYNANREIFIDKVSIVNDADSERLLNEFSVSKESFRKNETIVSLFAEQVRENPEANAVVIDGNSVTYKELDQKSNQVALVLKQQGVKKASIVPAYFERSIHFIEGIIGILKLGAAYFPIDFETPTERIQAILDVVDARIIVSEKNLKQKIDHLNVSSVFVDNLLESSDQFNSLQSPSIDANDLAYVIYTSGSSGKPKGVCCKHGSVINLLESFQSLRPLKPGMSGTLWTSFGFDVSIYEIWSCLLYGLTLHILADKLRKNIKALLHYLHNNRIHSLYLPAYILDELKDFSKEHQLSLKRLLVGVEPIDNEILYEISNNISDITVINGYGPTEATVCATLYKVNNKDYKITPIGKPIQNNIAYILDEKVNPVPVGFYGELYLGGMGLAEGYWSNEDENKKRFILNPFNNKAANRLFRTGDVARWLEDGNIEFFGRRDEQLKIRGFRIEPREITAWMNNFIGINSSYICVINNILVAYFVSDVEVQEEKLKAYLKRYLPDYMIPNYFVSIKHLPMTLDGKVNRKALPDPVISYHQKRIIVSPRNDIESKLVEIWKDILNQEQISLDDEFFSLGGDSIKLIRMISLSEDNKIFFSIYDVLRLKTIRKLAKSADIKDGRNKLSVTAFSLLEADDKEKVKSLPGIEDAYPLSNTQMAMLYYAEKNQSNSMYKTVFGIQLSGKIREDKVKACLEIILRNNQALRASFDLYQFSQPVQLIYKTIDLPFSYLNCTKKSKEKYDQYISSWWHNQIDAKFELSSAPLIRFFLCTLDDNTHFLGIAYHHVILDGWSIAVLLSSLLKLLNADDQEVKAQSLFSNIGIPQYLISEHEAEKNIEYKQFWKDYIDGFDYKLAPFIKKGASSTSRLLLTKSLSLSEVYLEKISQLADELSVSIKTIFIAVHLKVISVLMGKKDIITGITVNGRLPIDGFDKSLGVFVSAMPIRVDHFRNKTWKQLIETVYANEAKINKYSSYPLPNIIEASNHSNLFDILFNYLDFYIVENANELSSLKIKQISVYDHTNYPLLVNCEKLPNSVNVNFLYDPNKILKDDVSRLVLYYQTTLDDLLSSADLDNEISAHHIIPKIEFNKIINDWNDTKNFNIGKYSIIDLFSEQVKKSPNRIAVAFEEEEITYSQLDDRSNNLANLLSSKGVSDLSVVAVSMDRGINLIIVILAIVKLGACYLPIEKALPIKRKEFILKDSESACLIIDDENNEITELTDPFIINFNRISNSIKVQKKTFSKVAPDSPAYIIYTSGTTGLPKGVVQTHRTIVNLIQATTTNENNSLNTMQYCSISFDVHVQEIFYALLNGYTLNIATEAMKKDVTLLLNFIKANNINEIFLPTKVFEIFVEIITDEVTSLTKIYIAGEKLNVSRAVKSFIKNSQKIRLVNQYGPTETHVVTESYLTENNITSSSIGKPIANTKILILNQEQEVVPIGALGEIHVAGYGVSPGYMNREDLTKERFIKNPYYSEWHQSENIYAILYKTGDLAKWDKDGILEFVGRRDFQVKVRGYRIELAEIETILSQFPKLEQCVVIYLNHKDEQLLVAYYVAKEEIPDQTIVQYLFTQLPEYMIPSVYVYLKQMPLTYNGKIDRALLPIPNLTTLNRKQYIAPRNEIEQILAGIWREILGVDKIGLNDSFFSLGAHSLKLMQSIIKIKQIFNIDVSIDAIFKFQSIKSLAAHIQSMLLSAYPTNFEIPAASANDLAPISLTQERLWVVDKNMHGDSHHYNIPMAYHLTGALNVEALAKAFHLLIDRHQSLRTYFVEDEDGSVYQKIVDYEKEGSYPFDILKLDSIEECMEVLGLESLHQFNLKKPPLFYIKLFCVSDSGEYYLFINHHHIITDGWSIQILLSEISTLYNVISTGEIDPLKNLFPLTIQYSDYARWQRECLKGRCFNQCKEYWRKQLSDMQPLLLQTKGSRPENFSYNGAQYHFQFSKDLMDKLKHFSFQNGCTLFMTLLSGFSIMLGQDADQNDIVIGTAVANRNAPYLENMIGFFANILGLRVNLQTLNYRQLLMQVKETCLAAYQHQDIPFKVLLDELGIERQKSYTPVFQVMLLLQDSIGGDTLSFNGIKTESVFSHNDTSKLDLMLGLSETESGYLGIFEYNTDLFDSDTIKQMVFRYQKILKKILKSPDDSLDSITRG
ncbi:MAG: amino acid adenylation domain-containing protein [Legionellales bacterium]|nr:amino acid adenylation domain-containing protein [Legionellales bacterium]